MSAIVNMGPGQTDLKMIGGWARTGFPAIPGHEWAGTVDAVGTEVDPGLVGCRCVAENVLADGGEVGFEHPGGYGEYLVTEAPHRFPAEQFAMGIELVRSRQSDVIKVVLEW